MISVDEAFRRYEQEISPLPVIAVGVSTADALGRVLAEEVRAQIDLPPFPQSAMDGFALRSQDTQDATPERPVRLEIAGEIQAGRLREIPKLSPGEAMRIFTGGHLPQGADAVLRQEEAQIEGDRLLIKRALSLGEDVRAQGEEIRRGTTLAERGTRLWAGELAAITMAGVSEVRVHRAPKVTVLTTGDEVIPPGKELMPGEVYDANTPLVVGWLRSRGYREVVAAHLPDDLKGIEMALKEAFTHSDLVITTGGVSMGERDYILEAARNVGVRQIFWKVAQKPGKPLFFGTLNGKALIGLPGNPGAVFMGLVVHVCRVLDLLEGASPPGPRFMWGKLAFAIDPDPKRTLWVRCRISTGEISLQRLPKQGSHMISNLVDCTALVRIPPGSEELTPGSPVPWTPCGAQWATLS
jgi:molybdopterin molybdotransferase